jgi:hypothetical protein
MKNAIKKPFGALVPSTPAERKRKQRERDKAQGLVRHDVKAHAEDWAEIKRLILDLETARQINND